MKALVVMLVSFTVLAAFARAQRDYRTPVQVSRLAGPNATLLADDLSDFWAGAIAVAPNDILYAVGDGVILKFSPDGTIATRPAFFLDDNGGRVAARFSSAAGLAVDADDNAYVTTRNAVWKITPAGVAVVLADGLESPQAIAVGPGGNVIVAETGNHVIRQISADGILTTLAGQMGEPGSADGAESARFNLPTGVAVDARGNVFVADFKNNTIRMITPKGFVSTFAGAAGRSESVNGPRMAARFRGPYSVTLESSGTLWVTDNSGYEIRRITADGNVTTLAVTGGFEGHIEAGFIISIAVGAEGTLYFTDGWYGAVFGSAAPPSFGTPLISQTAARGGSATFRGVAEGAAPITYQWLKDGVTIPGATDAILTVGNVEVSSLGIYVVRATNAVGSVLSRPATLSRAATPGSGLMNLSLFGRAGPGEQALTVGFTIGGVGTTGTKPLLIRAIGPTLRSFDVAGALTDPTFSLYSGSTVVAANDNWAGDWQVEAVTTQVGGFAMSFAGTLDAALYHDGLGAGAYVAQISSVAGPTGVVLAEIHDATPASSVAASTPRLTNLSVRTEVGPDADALVASFTLGGTIAGTLLIRAVGPALAFFGMPGVLADPKIVLYDSAGRVIAENDNWSAREADTALLTEAAANIGAFPLVAGSKDAALVRTLPPGVYTVHASGVGRGTGIALVEVYTVP